MMKFVIAWLFLFTISLFAMDNNVSGQQIIKKNISLPQNNYLYHVIKDIKNNYVNENQSEEISLELKKTMFDWYLTQCAKTMQRENAIVIGTSKETVSSSYRVITFSENNALQLPVGKFYFPDGTVASGTTVKSDIPLDTNSLDDEALYEKITTIIKNR